MPMPATEIAGISLPIEIAAPSKKMRKGSTLEYVVIPQTQSAIRYITMKLDENERSATTRLMKVKDMILKQALEEKREQTARAAGLSDN